MFLHIDFNYFWQFKQFPILRHQMVFGQVLQYFRISCLPFGSWIEHISHPKMHFEWMKTLDYIKAVFPITTKLPTKEDTIINLLPYYLELK